MSSSQAWLTWAASTDNVGISRYDILRNGSVIASVSGSSYIDSTVAPSSAYSYQVVAYNAAGMTAASGTLTVTTPAPGMLVSDGFETGDLSQWSTVNGLTTESVQVHTGSYGAEAASAGSSTGPGSATYATQSLPGAYTELWAQTWVYVASRTSAVNLVGFERSSGASIVNLGLSPTGKLQVHDASGTVVSTTVMPTSGWHRVVLHALVSGTSGIVDVSLDGVQVADLSLTGQNLGTGPIAVLLLGDTSGASANNSYDVDFDDVGVAQNLL